MNESLETWAENYEPRPTGRFRAWLRDYCQLWWFVNGWGIPAEVKQAFRQAVLDGSWWIRPVKGGWRASIITGSGIIPTLLYYHTTVRVDGKRRPSTGCVTIHDTQESNLRRYMAEVRG